MVFSTSPADSIVSFEFFITSAPAPVPSTVAPAAAPTATVTEDTPSSSFFSSTGIAQSGSPGFEDQAGVSTAAIFG
ncbi:hypothetical protein KA037_05910 [Patescibacteria group bacterium]|nr:hypothetical protein [Patescibacteria group bacterium]